MKTNKRIPIVSGLLLGLALALSAGQLGVNISLPERGGTFVDMVKEGYRWSQAGTGQALTPAQVDSSGWPKVDAQYLADLRPVAEWSNSIDDPQTYRLDLSGTYKCAFSGRAAVRSIGDGAIQNLLYDSLSNASTFDFAVAGPAGAAHGFFNIEFTNTRRTAQSAIGSGITRFRMYRPGYALNTTKVFFDPFITAITGINFTTVRFMPFTNPNGIDPVYPGTLPWSVRKLTTDASQGAIAPLGKKDGGAWETVISLANFIHKDPWINVPVSADSNFIAKLATLFKDSLDPSLHVCVESSNEVWNTAPGYEQSAYNLAQATALGITDQQNHARRTVQLAQIFQNVFGAGSLNSRVRVILCSHRPMLKWWVEPMLQYVNTTFGQPKNFLYAIACQTYFGGSADTAGKSVARILADCHASIAGQMDDAGVNLAGNKQWVAKAASWGLPGGFCSYEGGPDHGGGSTVNVGNRINAERDSLMGELLKFNFDTAFFALGGNLAMQFTLSSGYNRYGCWGLTDDITLPDRNFKYRAAKAIAGSGLKNEAGISQENFLLSASPNPLTGTVLFQYRLTRPGGIALAIYDPSGRLIKTIKNGRQLPGVYSISWNGTDASGSRVAPGVYLLRNEPEGNRSCRSLIVLR
jgi:hypothetical protein